MSISHPSPRGSWIYPEEGVGRLRARVQGYLTESVFQTRQGRGTEELKGCTGHGQVQARQTQVWREGGKQLAVSPTPS